ncbi:ABC transporter ATP-binding protein [Thalassotalea ponticola]|uniref:ABC transporter ATP-binding protein n=1 Tax=Thalassotalea ponticola TaxID=1523392 RepID=UPI0025B4AF13|nr:ABC transporter ATP-binding protein [Thalassotalea ponticola]MDN3652212.1 ABC transporter ATP-binding protein [Thalassotalea ponticola]
MRQTALRCQQLSWRPQQHAVLRDIDLTVNSGEVVSVIGPNGAGKTSLLKCIAGLITDFEGRVFINEQPIHLLSRRQIAKQLAFVEQQHSNYVNLRCSDILQTGLIAQQPLFSLSSSTEQQQLQNALHTVGLSDHGNSLFTTLSGGEQQRLMIARALVQQSNIIVLDEPTNHLDIFYQQQILSLVRRLGVTVIMSLHDINLASYYSDKIALLNKGKVVAFGAVDEVLTPSLLEPVFHVRSQVSKQRCADNTWYTHVQFAPSKQPDFNASFGDNKGAV